MSRFLYFKNQEKVIVTEEHVPQHDEHPSTTPNAPNSRMRWTLVASVFVMAGLITQGQGIIGWATGADEGAAFGCGSSDVVEGVPAQKMSQDSLQYEAQAILGAMDSKVSSQADMNALAWHFYYFNRNISDETIRNANLNKFLERQKELASRNLPAVHKHNDVPNMLSDLRDDMNDVLADTGNPNAILQYHSYRNQYLQLLADSNSSDEVAADALASMPLPNNASAPTLATIQPAAAVQMPVGVGVSQTQTPGGAAANAATTLSAATALPTNMLNVVTQNDPGLGVTWVPGMGENVQTHLYDKCVPEMINGSGADGNTILDPDAYAMTIRCDQNGGGAFSDGASDLHGILWAQDLSTIEGLLTNPVTGEQFTIPDPNLGVTAEMIHFIIGVLSLTEDPNIKLEVTSNIANIAVSPFMVGTVVGLELMAADNGTEPAGDQGAGVDPDTGGENPDGSGPAPTNTGNAFNTCTLTPISNEAQIGAAGDVTATLSCLNQGGTGTGKNFNLLGSHAYGAQSGNAWSSSGYALSRTAAVTGYTQRMIDLMTSVAKVSTMVPGSIKFQVITPANSGKAKAGLVAQTVKVSYVGNGRVGAAAIPGNQAQAGTPGAVDVPADFKSRDKSDNTDD